MKRILGVDGGGSKTFAVVTDQNGNLLGKGISGCGNHQVKGIEYAMGHIREAVDQALSQARAKPSEIDRAQFGLAGADRARDFSILRPALQALPFSNWDVVCDTMEGLRTGSSTNVGIVLVCGAGTNAAGRNEEGKIVQTGGFGYMFGDAAGGFDMARETFRMAVRSWEYREEPSVLQKKVAEFHGFSGMEEVFNDYLDHENYRVPHDLTLLLHEAADEGDALAIRILQKTGRELGIAANSVIRRLGGFREEPIPVVLTGSVLQKGKNPHLLKALKTTMENENHCIRLVIPEMAPVYGAVMLGMDQLDLKVTKEIETQFIKYGGHEL